MNKKEKLELKIEILEDLRECFGFNWGAVDYSLQKRKIEDLYQKYCIEYEEEKNSPQATMD